jgi:hypothetical protein
MADPFDTKVQPRARVKDWASTGIPKDPTAAKKRIQASRAKRKKTRQKTSISMHTYVDVLEAIDDLADRYDVPRALILKKFLEDGLRTYGNADEMRKAQIEPSPAPNPFIDATPPPPQISGNPWPLYTGGPVPGVAPLVQYEQYETSPGEYELPDFLLPSNPPLGVADERSS